MKAILLAAGLGTRLRPLTDTIPKCLVSIDGKPLLAHWLESLCAAGVESILINLHHHAEQVEDFVANRPESKLITLAYEKELLGTAGTLRDNSHFFSGEPGMVIHADNFCPMDLTSFIRAHETRPVDTELTMMTFLADEPRTCGIIEADENGIVHEFHEKVENPPGNVANAATYIFEQSVIQFISLSLPGELVDISRDVIPRFLGRIFAFPADGPVIDIGTPKNLRRAQSCALALEAFSRC